MEAEYQMIIDWCRQNADRFPSEMQLQQGGRITDVPRFIEAQIALMSSDNHIRITILPYERLLLFRKVFYDTINQLVYEDQSEELHD